MYLQELDLKNNKIWSLPKELGQLSNLKELLLEGNNIEELPKELGNLISLQGLDLDGNELHKLPAELCNLISLNWLFLERNHITELPSEIGQLVSLQRLYIDNNNISFLPEEIQNLPCLEFLYVEHNPLYHYSTTPPLIRDFKVPSLKALCAKVIVDNLEISKSINILPRDLKEYLKEKKECQLCHRFYFESCAKGITFIDFLYYTDLPILTSMCSYKCTIIYKEPTKIDEIQIQKQMEEEKVIKKEERNQIIIGMGLLVILGTALIIRQHLR